MSISGYTPNMPDEDTINKLSGMVSKNIMARVFQPSMPDIHKTFNKMLGTLRESFKDDFEARERIDKINISNEDAVNIFIDYVLPEYERLLDQDEAEVDSGSNREVDGEGISELAQGNDGGSGESR